jgi:hypothetical protein
MGRLSLFEEPPADSRVEGEGAVQVAAEAVNAIEAIEHRLSKSRLAGQGLRWRNGLSAR